MDVLAIDIGGTNVKILATGQTEPRKFNSGPDMTPQRMVDQVKKLASDWKYDVVSIGYPGVVMRGRPISEPHNLAKGWVGFPFEKAFGRPVKVINDAAMQALGGYKKGKCLFLGLGTGLGSAMIVDGHLEPMELAHLPYKRATYEDYVGLRGLQRLGKKKWRENVNEVVAKLAAALEPDEVVLGGGNAKKLKALPKGTRLGNNFNAFIGGFRLWGEGVEHLPPLDGDLPVASSARVDTPSIASNSHPADKANAVPAKNRQKTAARAATTSVTKKARSSGGSKSKTARPRTAKHGNKAAKPMGA